MQCVCLRITLDKVWYFQTDGFRLFLEWVQKAKMLGVTFSVDLKWNAHVDEIVKKVNKAALLLTLIKV